jgi:tetratricopeptide (TPR) repeat protein
VDEGAVLGALVDLSWILMQAGRPEESEQYNQEGLRLFRRKGIRSGVIYCLISSGRNAADPERALLHFEEAISLARELERPHALVDAMIASHDVYLALGQYEAAHKVAQEMARIVTDQDIGYLVDFTTQRECAAMHLGDYGGVARIEQVLEKCIMGGDRQMIANQRLYLGQLATVNGSAEQALHHLEAAHEAYQALEHPKAGLARALLALVLLDLGQIAEAERIIQRLLGESARQTGLLPVLVTATLLLARTGRPEQAIAIYRWAEAQPMIGNSRWYWDVAGRKIAALATDLPADTVAAAGERFQGQELVTVVGHLQNAIGQPTEEPS